MKSIKKLNRVALAVAGAAAFFAGPALALDLSGQGWVQYGDAQSYSLPILALQNCPKPNQCEFKVDSTPGAIKGLTVLGTGSSGTGVVENFDGMDNAYATPNGSGTTFWRPGADTATVPETNGTVMNNSQNSWDASLSALKTYLTTGSDVEEMIFFFNNNQFNGEEQSLAAWASIVVRGPGDDGANTILGRFDFVNKATFGGTPGAYLPVPQGGGVLNGNTNTYTAPLVDTRLDPNAPFAGDRASTDYVLSGGEICLDGTAPGANVVPCSGPHAVGPINHNLGADQAAYAIMFPELDALLATLWGKADLADYTLSVDVRLGCDPRLVDTALVCTGQAAKGNQEFLYGRNLTNGFEQIFIAKGSAVTIIEVPEPGTLLLAGLALVGLAGLRRRG